jgi:hypothetical protein
MNANDIITYVDIGLSIVDITIILYFFVYGAKRDKVLPKKFFSRLQRRNNTARPKLKNKKV